MVLLYLSLSLSFSYFILVSFIPCNFTSFLKIDKESDKSTLSLSLSLPPVTLLCSWGACFFLPSLLFHFLCLSTRLSTPEKSSSSFNKDTEDDKKYNNKYIKSSLYGN